VRTIFEGQVKSYSGPAGFFLAQHASALLAGTTAKQEPIKI
jgi:hypothetical protein